jgi:hypothetical protein
MDLLFLHGFIIRTIQATRTGLTFLKVSALVRVLYKIPTESTFENVHPQRPRPHRPSPAPAPSAPQSQSAPTASSGAGLARAPLGPKRRRRPKRAHPHHVAPLLLLLRCRPDHPNRPHQGRAGHQRRSLPARPARAGGPYAAVA